MDKIALLDSAPYAFEKEQKQQVLLAKLNELSEQHFQRCPAYQAVFEAHNETQGGELDGKQSGEQVKERASEFQPATTIEEVPFLTVALFKQLALKSVPDSEVFKVLTSSGTTGQTPSKIFLDAETAKNQSRALVKIMQDWIGKQRLPFLIWDSPDVITNRASYSARGAGIQGLSFLGRRPVYAFHPDMSLNIPALEAFFAEQGDVPVLMFGFTFMVWKYGLSALKQQGLNFPFKNAVLIHSGGWKKLEDEAVSAGTFNQTAQETLGKVRVHNFYGMVEQVGSIFVACEAGHFHCPNFAEVIIRQPGSWQEAPQGEAGLIQVLSMLPESHPGHSLLTEDRGRILGEDDCPCGRKGKYFEVLGRLPKVEARGCSDTFEPSATPVPKSASEQTNPNRRRHK